jgi:protein O-GlcNAc transferase
MVSRLAQAALALKRGELQEAARIILIQVKENQQDGHAWYLLARTQELQRHTDDALASYERASTLLPGEYRVWTSFAGLLQRLGRFEDALARIDVALKISPASADIWHQRGQILVSIGRVDDAIADFEESLRLGNSQASVHYDLALGLANRGRFQDALVQFDGAILWSPIQPDFHNGRGIVLRALGRHPEALAAFDQAISLNSQLAHLHYNRGISLHDLNDCSQAVQAFTTAIELSAGVPEFYVNRAAAWRQLRHYENAARDYGHAIKLNPRRPDYHGYLGSALLDMGDPAAALRNFSLASTLAPESAEFSYLCGTALEDMKRFTEAAASFETALRLDPAHPFAFNGLSRSALASCDWKRVADIQSQLPSRIRDGNTIFAPFVLLGYQVSDDLQLEATERYLSKLLPAAASVRTNRKNEKLRLGYLSSDFGEHATAYLAFELFEHHDRDKFEVIGFSFGPTNNTPARQRLVAAFDAFHEIGHLGDEDAARFIDECGIDICIDLKGHTRDARPCILAYRPAPLQITYLGYPATVGRCGIDYVLADEVVLPASQQPWYPETIFHLPGTYQVNSRRMASPDPSDRQRQGLPCDRFVFGCFSNNWKISAPIFDVWMNLLSAVPESVLWLISDNLDAQGNLRRMAEARGIAASRLIFAQRVSQQEHLARQYLADLFLDTLPYNGHTTASDALCAGVPIVTCMGDRFAGRVAASLLYALELPELITHSLKDYETVARSLALDRDLLQSIATKLRRNWQTAPALKADMFCREVERAYLRMWDQHRQTC